MPNKTTIEWTDFTSNPIRFRVKGSGERAWHCEKVSPGCAHCYAEGLELGRFGLGWPFTPAGGKDLEAYLDEDELKKILTMKPREPGRLGAGKPRMIFIGDMTDIFGDWVPDVWLDKLFAVMALRPDLIFQVLSKRAHRMAEYFKDKQRHNSIELAAEALKPGREAMGGKHILPLLPLPNVWLGVSVEDQPRADERIPHLLRCPAAVRWLSCEPLLGPLDLDQPRCEKHDREFARVDEHYGEICTECAADGGTGEMPCGMWLDGCAIENKSGIGWVVLGGESGRFARPPHPDWFRSLRDQCQAEGVPFFFKQWGGWLPASIESADLWVGPRGELGNYCSGVGFTPMRSAGKKSAGRMLDGRTHDAYPEVRA